jgi:hypothetical protein
MKTVETIWELWTYDVWGNERDGYEVNDRSCFDREYPMTLKVETASQGTDLEFTFAYPTDRQIRNAFGIGKYRITLDGDDTHIYITADVSGYPVGELYCTSHDSLSPIRPN